jgi:uncharacterized protein
MEYCPMTSIATRSIILSEKTSNERSQRQYGFDVARGLAVFGMIIVNFKIAMGAETAGPSWMVWLVGLLEGRAAATFVILAGVGMSLLTHRARTMGDTRLLKAKRTILFKRAAFLFCFGLTYSQLWQADILHFYGVYILLGALILDASDRQLISIAVVFILFFDILFLFLDYEKGWDWQTLNYHDFWTFAGMLRHLFFNGFHPVIPWTAFLIFGMWLGRKDMSHPGIRKKIFCFGLSAVIFAETASHVLTNQALSAFPNANPEDIRFIFETNPMPPTMLYMLSAGGTAIMSIVASIVLTEKFKPSAWFIKPLITSGQFALTFYIAHVVIGIVPLEMTGHLYQPNITMAVISSFGFSLMGVVAALIWSQHFSRGPLEWLLRRVTS